MDVRILDGTNEKITSANPLPVTPGTAAPESPVSTATLSAVNSSAASQTLKAANSARKGLIIVNTDANPLYIKYGATATLSAGGFTYIVGPGVTWEMPTPIYTGVVDGIWTADGAGAASITEL